METMKRVVTVAVSLALVAVTRGSQSNENAEPSNTRQMRCIVKVTADIDLMPAGFDLLDSLLRSDAVAGRAAQRAWPAGYGERDTFFDVRPLGDSGPRRRTTSDVASPETREVLFELQIHVGNDVAPAAREFSIALIENLEVELQKASAVRDSALRRQLAEARSLQDAIHRQFDSLVAQSRSAHMEQIRLDPEDEAVNKQLEQVVVLSSITMQTPLQEAFEILAHSVEPPLQIAVLWRDLEENAGLDPVTLVAIDGLTSIRLSTAMERLLNAISDPLYPDNPVEFAIDHGVITVATHDGLPHKKMETRVYDLPLLLRVGDQASETAALIRETIEPKSWFDLYLASGEGTIATSPEGRLIVSQSRDIHIRIQELLAELAANASVTPLSEASNETLAQRMDSLMAYRSQLEEELDRLQLRQVQISREKQDEKGLTVRETCHAIAGDLYAAVAELSSIQLRVARDRLDGAENQKFQQTIRKIEQCANRCNQIQLNSGPVLDKEPPSIEKNEEGTVALRIAAKQRDLREVSRRIADIQRAMVRPAAINTELGRVQWAARGYKQANAQVQFLEDRIANLQPCAVTVIGAAK